MAGKQILLIEPGYKNKYPPLGLMKIAQYHLRKQDEVVFVKGEDYSVSATAWDRIYVTTLFSFEFPKIERSIDFAIEIANGQRNKVFVGGIAASLMPDEFQKQGRWQGVRVIQGLLKDAPAKALQLDEYLGEFYADDLESTPIEDLTPDYSILDQIEYKYPVRDAYFAYASRGCIRKCSFCGVPKLEGDLKDNFTLTSIVNSIESLYGPKRDLILMDNNIVASPRFKDVIAEIRDLGFVPGALLKRGKVVVQRRVDFNQGVDARILSKDRMYLRALSSIAIRPLRIAFDHLGLRAPYETSIRFAHEFGLNDLSNYMLYNFHDSPADLYHRMKMNVDLNEELNIRIYSFPMRFQPTDLPSRSHVGEKWTSYQLRSMQIVLQATHGVVSGEPIFFKSAFGSDVSEFERTIAMPHHFIFNRDWYRHFGGSAELEEFESKYSHLSASQKSELLQILSTGPTFNAQMLAETSDSQLRSILPFYRKLPREEEARIWESRRTAAQQSVMLADDEYVEDAGLQVDDIDFDNAPARIAVKA
jgi:hypothetical protein